MRKVEGIAVVVARRGDLSVHPSNHPSGAAPQRNSFQINAIQLHFPSCLAKFKCLRTESEATKKSTIGHLSTNVKLFFFFLFLASSSLLIHLIKYPKGWDWPELPLAAGRRKWRNAQQPWISSSVHLLDTLEKLLRNPPFLLEGEAWIQGHLLNCYGQCHVAIYAFQSHPLMYTCVYNVRCFLT